MNTTDLIKELSVQCSITKNDAKKIVRLFFDKMEEALKRKDGVEIRGLWTFYMRNYGQYLGRNPNTGEPIQVKSKKMPHFKMGKDLQERLMKSLENIE